MKILSIRPLPHGGGEKNLARFDVEVSEQLRLYGLLLRQWPDGTRRIAAPQANGRHMVTFHSVLAAEITDHASQAYEGHNADHRFSH
ncbi:hypothetical protein ASD64_14645 [Mesorhizobium sp. Root157]|uniref:hypothetical protein n=1 Tax=Mesorhizobium sp. Root157 TaxID=1736477 RepID=UPI0006F96B0F|nr:hypothetical protein [Mesorhizobium sp. Root157]KQZ99567.1 hypothetical protein ASD64_14645 [Mesorhizobium sp. Root157]